MMTFIHISDPAHGWLEVPMALIEQLGIRDRISNYSYRFGKTAYLEEDCDAPLVLRALKQQGIEYQLDELYQERTPIRRYPRFVDQS